FGAARITFPDALFDSGNRLPIFKWFVTATSGTGNSVNNCQVLAGTNESLDEEGQDITTPPTGPATHVAVTQCSFTVTAAAAYQGAPGQAAPAMPAGGMELGLRRARTGEIERR